MVVVCGGWYPHVGPGVVAAGAPPGWKWWGRVCAAYAGPASLLRARGVCQADARCCCGAGPRPGQGMVSGVRALGGAPTPKRAHP